MKKAALTAGKAAGWILWISIFIRWRIRILSTLILFNQEYRRIKKAPLCLYLLNFLIVPTYTMYRTRINSFLYLISYQFLIKIVICKTFKVIFILGVFFYIKNFRASITTDGTAYTIILIDKSFSWHFQNNFPLHCRFTRHALNQFKVPIHPFQISSLNHSSYPTRRIFI